MKSAAPAFNKRAQRKPLRVSAGPGVIPKVAWRLALSAEKKKRHHFVWRKYLRKWAPDEKIACLMESRIFETDLMNVGQEKYFYKLKELTLEEVAFLKALIERDKRPLIRDLNHGWIDFFNQVFEVKSLIEARGISDPKIDNMLDVLICNFEEDFHCQIESDGERFLESLYNEDVSFYYDDDEIMPFLFFLGQQYFRTSKLKTNIVRSLGGFRNLNIDAMWSVLRHTSATALGCSIYQDRNKFKPIVLTSDSDVPFVTGDQPIINTYAVGLDLEEEPQDLEFYYPVSPCLALLLTCDEQYGEVSRVPVTGSIAAKYNGFVYEQSHRQIFAASSMELEKLCSNQ